MNVTDRPPVPGEPLLEDAIRLLRAWVAEHLRSMLLTDIHRLAAWFLEEYGGCQYIDEQGRAFPEWTDHGELLPIKSSPPEEAE